jgi:hypothetical protein
VREHLIATLQEARLFTYIEPLTGDYHFARGGLVLAALWESQPLWENQPDGLPERLIGPSFDEDSLRQRYRRYFDRVGKGAGPVIALLQGEDSAPLDRMMTFWIQELHRSV